MSIVINFLKNLERSISSRMQLSLSMGWESFFAHVNPNPISWFKDDTPSPFIGWLGLAEPKTSINALMVAVVSGAGGAWWR
jgi:hypothetical protein